MHHSGFSEIAELLKIGITNKISAFSRSSSAQKKAGVTSSISFGLNNLKDLHKLEEFINLASTKEVFNSINNQEEVIEPIEENSLDDDNQENVSQENLGSDQLSVDGQNQEGSLPQEESLEDIEQEEASSAALNQDESVFKKESLDEQVSSGS